MELIYFISGILTVGVVYGVILLRGVKSSHADLLARHQSQSNISSIQNSNLWGELEDIKVLTMDIQTNMEKDQYESLSEINRRIKELDKVTYGNLEKLKFAGESNQQNFKKVFNEIQQLKNNVKALGQDPNFVSRY